MDRLERGYHSKIKWKGTTKEKAMWLVDYIWGLNDSVKKESSLLTDSIDSVIRSEVVGDCLSLSSLYAVMGLRIGIEEIGVCHYPGHIFNFVCCEEGDILIDLTNPHMFNFSPYCDFKKGGLDLLISRVWNNRANDLFEEDLDLAILYLEKALEIDPNCIEALAISAPLYAQEGKLRLAFENIEKAIKLEPRLAKNYNLRAYVKEAAGDIEGAIQDVRSAIDLDPTDPDFSINLKELLEEWAQRDLNPRPPG